MKAKNIKVWRNKVLERDNYICRDCGEQSNLLAHHIKSQFVFPHLKLRVENGITLCRQCHRKRLGFALRLFPYAEMIKKSYLPKMPTREQTNRHQEVIDNLASLPRIMRNAYRSKGYKIRGRRGAYRITFPKMWTERVRSKTGLSLNNFLEQYRAEWLFNDFGGAFVRFVREGK